MKSLFVLIAAAMFLSSCSQGVQNASARVLDNAGGIIRGSKTEVSNNWQKADGSNANHESVEATPTPTP